MTMTTHSGLSLTHTGSDKLTKNDIAYELEQIKDRLTVEFKTDQQQLRSLLHSLEALSEFELGRFLIKNKSLSGYWTWYIISGFREMTITSPVENFLLQKAPAILATQQRFSIFQSLLLQYIKSNSVVCSLPCGMMADLLTLNLGGNIEAVRYIGIDLDPTVFDAAKALAGNLNVQHSYEFHQKDAWNLNIDNEFDVITSNGLNIYVKDDSKVVALYKEMFRALKTNGRLICSALTPPPTMTQDCEWDMGMVNTQDLAMTATIMKTILQATWSNFRSSEETCNQLREAGFQNIEIFWDRQKMFPTFTAQKISDSN